MIESPRHELVVMYYDAIARTEAAEAECDELRRRIVELEREVDNVYSASDFIAADIPREV